MQTHRSARLLPADWFPHLHSAPSLVQLYSTLSGWEMVMNKFRAFHCFVFVFQPRKIQPLCGEGEKKCNLHFHEHEKPDTHLSEPVGMNCCTTVKVVWNVSVVLRSILEDSEWFSVRVDAERLRNQVVRRLMHVRSRQHETWGRTHSDAQTSFHTTQIDVSVHEWHEVPADVNVSPALSPQISSAPCQSWCLANQAKWSAIYTQLL